jgi:dihydrofolate reductase
MRRLRYQVAVSLDGFIAGPDDDASWIPMDPDIDFAALFEQFDTFLMGRRTWEQAGAISSGGHVVVVSTTLDPAANRSVTVINDEVVERVKSLKNQPGKDIWLFGGGLLFRFLLAEGLVDTVEPAIVPVLLGEGTRFLPEPALRARLVLASHRVFPRSGIVLLQYAVATDSRSPN